MYSITYYKSQNSTRYCTARRDLELWIFHKQGLEYVEFLHTWIQYLKNVEFCGGIRFVNLAVHYLEFIIYILRGKRDNIAHIVEGFVGKVM